MDVTAAHLCRQRITERVADMRQLLNSSSLEHSYRQLVRSWLFALHFDDSPQSVQRIVYRLCHVPPERALIACCIADEAVCGLQSAMHDGQLQIAMSVLALMQGCRRLSDICAPTMDR